MIEWRIIFPLVFEEFHRSEFDEELRVHRPRRCSTRAWRWQNKIHQFVVEIDDPDSNATPEIKELPVEHVRTS